ncbi:uncharacterized protein K444DRAFT_235364 [Hyaloscypha bicolor E]|uniref:Ig-like domain-containing protein n=1 Tax=Hyaloscypha bicolor E TaxID=1095630 RepID=A0A2J6SLH2_9HELO|nr:uncharacterized protein K444DRAFT_235364 [Hyaloscypha bicolor E]PMD51622.1 hypothetical protein K444DRAFT_235364 [Hyaloscypha bicolor E]
MKAASALAHHILTPPPSSLYPHPSASLQPYNSTTSSLFVQMGSSSSPRSLGCAATSTALKHTISVPWAWDRNKARTVSHHSSPG